MNFAGRTDVGCHRQDNQDCYGTSKGERAFFALVCDGMGGAAAGDLAARTACDSILQDVTDELDIHRDADKQPMDQQKVKGILWSAVNRANERVFELSRSREELRGMGTTVVMVLCYYGKVYVAHVGDSRAYLLRGGRLRRLTSDHSLVQNLIDAGTLTEEEARVHPSRNVITRAVGVAPEVSAEYGSFLLQAGDTFLLCSDGLSGLVTDGRMAEILVADKSAQILADALVAEALDNGGDDNVTALVARAGEEDLYTVWEALTDVRTEDITATFLPGERPELSANDGEVESE